MITNKILLDHGSGGIASHKLISELILHYFTSPILADLDDSAVFTLGGQKLAFSTDSYTVDPIFFPGGDIGDLAINGTVNDLAMCGAIPHCLSVGLIIEEGFPMADLEKILKSMQQSASAAKVQIVTGDTKVIPNGAADGIFINTSGIGIIPDGVNISGKNAAPGDRVLINGYIGDHGMTVLTSREGLKFQSVLQSDTAPLNRLVAEMLAVSDNIHTLRDPTRGGVGTSLNEIARQANVGIRLYEDRLPVRAEVTGVCELLGLDPLYVANEGKLVACVAANDAEKILHAMKKNQYGRDAVMIGEVLAEHPGKVFLSTTIGGTRIVDMLTGEQLPRIC